MTNRLQQFAANYPLLSRWAGLLSVTGGGQLAIQGLGFLSGILVIRLLSPEQYAYYTLVNTMLGTMTVLADGGISAAVMAEGGKVWQDRRELGRVLATGLDLRRKFALGSMAVSLPILYYLLDRQGVPYYWSLLLIVALMPTFYAALSTSLLNIVPRLHQEVNRSLGIDVRMNVWRLVATLGGLLLFPFAVSAILASGLGQLRANALLRKLSSRHADWAEAPPDPEYRRRILRVVRRVLPGSIYYCLSGQITVWLISIFGSTTGIAQIGALGRLMVLLMLIQSSLDLLIVPRFARLLEERRQVVLRFLQVLGAVSAVALALVGAVWLLPEVFLFILGPDYADLEREVLLMTVSSSLSLIGSTINRLASARAIIPNPAVFLGVIIGGQALILAFLVDYGTVTGVLWFGIYAALLGVIFRIIHFFYHSYSTSDR